jgi:glutaconate CoA-transferase, subunit B
MNEYTTAELTCAAASRQIADGETVFVGVGKPVIAAFLAKLTHAPDITILFETGIVRTRPCELPMLLDTVATQTDADKLDTAGYVTALAARGRVHLGMIGAGQVDRRGNVNSVAAGSYSTPAVRWPGGGGANDIGSLCRRTVVVLDQRAHRLPERVDFVTSPGYVDDAGNRAPGLPPGGPAAIVTDLATFVFENGAAMLRTRHPGVTAEQLTRNTGWALGDQTGTPLTEPPTEEELHLMRTVIDPHNVVLEKPDRDVQRVP